MFKIKEPAFTQNDVILLEGVGRLSCPKEVSLVSPLSKSLHLRSPFLFTSDLRASSVEEVVVHMFENGSSYISPSYLGIEHRAQMVRDISKRANDILEICPDDIASLPRYGINSVEISLQDSLDDVNELIHAGCELLYLNGRNCSNVNYIDKVEQISTSCDLTGVYFMLGDFHSPNLVEFLLDEEMDHLLDMVIYRPYDLNKFPISHLMGIRKMLESRGSNLDLGVRLSMGLAPSFAKAINAGADLILVEKFPGSFKVDPASLLSNLQSSEAWLADHIYHAGFDSVEELMVCPALQLLR
jgi:hypothetical protein